MLANSVDPDQMLRSAAYALGLQKREARLIWVNIKIEPRHEKTCFMHMRTAKVQISLRIRAVRSASLFSMPR